MVKKLIFAIIVGLLGGFAWIVVATLFSIFVIFFSMGADLSFGPLISSQNFRIIMQIIIFLPALFILTASLFFIFIQSQTKGKSKTR